MRAESFAAACAAALLAACTPPQTEAPPAPLAETAAPAEAPVALVDANAVILSGPPGDGIWTFHGDGPEDYAAYNHPDSNHGWFYISCNRAANRATIFIGHDSPSQDTTLGVLTATQTAYMPAHSPIEAMPSTIAEIDGADPRLDMLKPAQERFAIEVAGEAFVFPWDQSINRTLTTCGA